MRASRARHLAAATGLVVLMGACGKQPAPDLVNGKRLFSQRCASCHVLERAEASGTIGPDLDAAFVTSRRDGLGADTIEGVVRGQIANPRASSAMPPALVKGADARDVAAYVASAAGRPGEDTGRLAGVGLAGAKSGEQVFSAAGCGACHTLKPAGTKSSAGPALDQLARAATARTGLSAEAYVRQSIVEPDAFVVRSFRAGVMPRDYARRLKRAQIDALVDYLLKP